MNKMKLTARQKQVDITVQQKLVAISFILSFVIVLMSMFFVSQRLHASKINGVELALAHIAIAKNKHPKWLGSMSVPDFYAINRLEARRIKLMSNGIKQFLKGLKHKHPKIYTSSINDWINSRYMFTGGKTKKMTVEPSEYHKHLNKINDDLFSLISQFKDNKDIVAMLSYQNMRILFLKSVHVRVHAFIQPAEAAVE